MQAFDFYRATFQEKLFYNDQATHESDSCLPVWYAESKLAK